MCYSIRRNFWRNVSNSLGPFYKNGQQLRKRISPDNQVQHQKADARGRVPSAGNLQERATDKTRLGHERSSWVGSRRRNFWASKAANGVHVIVQTIKCRLSTPGHERQHAQRGHEIVNWCLRGNSGQYERREENISHNCGWFKRRIFSAKPNVLFG